MRAYLNLRHWVSDRAQAFREGLAHIGYTDIRAGVGVGELFVTWNRIQVADAVAAKCLREGVPVIVAENPSWGAAVSGQWLHVSRTLHNTAGTYRIGDTARWDGLGVDLEPWREQDGETVVLAQRGIGSWPTAQPRAWHLSQAGRVRAHPGKRAGQSLREDLARASKVVTWGSAAAVQAAIWGIRVESHMPNWIGDQDNTDSGRIRMLRNLAWAQWTLREIADGTAFSHLLG